MTLDIIVGSIFFVGAMVILFWAVSNGQLWGVKSSTSSSKLTFLGALKAVAKPIIVPWDWSGKYMIVRWVVVGAAVIMGYSYLQSSQGDVRQVTQETRSDGSILLRFELPEGHNRIEFLETFAVAIARRDFIKPDQMPLIGLRFIGGTLYEYNVRGETTMRNGISWLTGVPLGEAGSTVKHYGTKLSKSGITGLLEHSELEWDGPPYTIQVFVEPGGTPIEFGSTDQIRYRVLTVETKTKKK